MARTISNQDWSENPADGGKSGRGSPTTSHLLSKKYQELYPGCVMA